MHGAKPGLTPRRAALAAASPAPPPVSKATPCTAPGEPQLRDGVFNSLSTHEMVRYKWAISRHEIEFHTRLGAGAYGEVA